MYAILFMGKSVCLALTNQDTSWFDTGKHTLPKQASQRRFLRGTPGIHVAMTYVQHHGIASFLEPQQQVALVFAFVLAFGFDFAYGFDFGLAFSCHLFAL
jgi:hypothetical protein